ncbi:MAG: protein translocase subunit SecF [Candidatus Nanoarchaeia archaeon]|nr:protein translocase subunit SecF [Candidatus Nanoarchaeia archaeon]
MGKLASFYERNCKKLFIIPLLMIVVATLVIFNFYNETGDIMNKDVSLKGGITATIYTGNEVSLDELSNKLNEAFSDSNIRKLSEFGSTKQLGIIVEIGEVDEPKLKSLLEGFFGFTLNDQNYSVEVVGSSLGESFYKQMSIAILVAFLFMALVIFLLFRNFIPSIAVVFAAFSDILITLAVVDLIGLRIGTAGIASFLLLIGYSVDTDVLLTTKVLKEKEGSLFARIYDSMRTGLTMTCSTLVALVIGYFVSTSFILKEMFLIIFIGLVADVVVTYLGNAPLLVWYVKRKEK